MNKDEIAKMVYGNHEASKLSILGLTDIIAIREEQLIAFANACEKIGMEKAANICEAQVQDYHPDGEPRRMEYFCAEAIRKAI